MFELSGLFEMFGQNEVFGPVHCSSKFEEIFHVKAFKLNHSFISAMVPSILV